MTCEGSPIQESRIYDGVLLEAPELNNLAMNYEVLGPEPLKVALFDISMAGDTQEWFEGIDTEATASAGHVDVTEGVLKQMLQVVDKLVSLGVKVVACQRCMHPALKEYLKDRVSSSVTNEVKIRYTAESWSCRDKCGNDDVKELAITMA